MSLDIVLSTFNGERYLFEQIDSITLQTFNNWTILIKDDNSIDSTKKNSLQISKEFPKKISIIDNDSVNTGPLASFSALIRKSDSNYIMLCDQDDFWLPDKIEKTLAAMRIAEDRFGVNTPLLIHTDLCVVDRELKPIFPSFWKFQNLNPRMGMNLNRVMPQNVVTGCTVMINRPLAEIAMPIPEDAIMHDWWLALVATLFGQVVYLDEATILYRQHANNTLGAKRWGLKRIVERVQQFQEVRDSMLRTMGQAQALLDRYRNQMTSEQIALVEAYARLPFMSKAARVGTLFKYRFFKHGLIRNIGFLANLLILDHSTP